MKYSIIVLSFLFVPTLGYAQLVNGGFESWTDASTRSGSPDGWSTNNVQGYYSPVTSTTDKHSGSYAVQMQVVNYFSLPIIPILNAGEDYDGFGISQSYTSLSGYYKLLPNDDEILVLTVLLYKNNEYIGVGSRVIKDATSSYIKFEAPITYFADGPADKIDIQFLIADSSGDQLPTIGTVAYIDDLILETATTVQSSMDQKPESFVLYQNYPNPFNPSTRIKFELKSTSFVSLQVFNSIGQPVAVLIEGMISSGQHSVLFSAQDLSSGMYLVRLTVNGIGQTIKMTLLE